MTEIQEMAQAIYEKHKALWPLTWAVADFMAKQLAGDQGYLIVNQLTHELMGLNTEPVEPAPEPRDKRVRPSYLDQAVIDRVAESSARHLEEIGRGLAEPAPAQDEQYPPCDYCGVIPDHHPWHGSGMFNGEDSPHIHACNDCRHLLPASPAQTEQQLVAWRRVVERLIANVEIFDERPRPMCRDCADRNGICESGLDCDIRALVKEARAIIAAPIAQTAPQSEFGDAYQGAREDLAIWKRRALEAEQKVRQQEQIIDHLTLEAQGETRMGEPAIPQTAPQPEA